MISVNVLPGRYVVAVSGGVDSMVLLDLLRQQPRLDLVVAHFDHGARLDSAEDRRLVERVSMSHNVPFVYAEGQLGSDVSEEVARAARYKFLRHTCEKYNASALITAHHQDDLMETALINILRGTGWRGLSSLRSTLTTARPLLGTSKAAIYDYALSHGVEWREDSTNASDQYLRNYVRRTVLKSVPSQTRQNLLEIIVRQNELTGSIDAAMRDLLQQHVSFTPGAASLPRYQLIMMPQHVAHETLQAILRRVSGKSAERPLLAGALLFAKVAKSGKRFQLSANWQLRVTHHDLIVEVRPDVVS